MKKLTNTIITMFFMIIALSGMSTLTAEAAGKGKYFQSGELYYHTISKNKVEVCGTTREKGTLVIPSSVYYKGKKYTVTQIADHETYYQDSVDTTDGNYVDVDMAGWRYYRYDRVDGKEFPGNVNWISGSPITKVILPSTLTYIGEGAFGSCTKLKSVVFASSYKKLTIGKNAFDGTSLKSIRFPKGTYELKDCAAGTVQEIYIPASVKKIGAGVVNCNTKKVIIDKKNKKFKMKDGILYSYNEKMLLGVSAKVKKNVKISSKTTKLSKVAFAGTKVKTVTLNNKIKVIPEGAFCNCTKLTAVKNTDNVEKINYAAFTRCSKLTDIGSLPNLTQIERAAFWEDYKLTVHLSEKVTIVDEYAFGGFEYPTGVKVTVAENHPVFSIQGNLLIQTTATDKIVVLQLNEAEQITIPEGVTYVACYVGGESCKEIILPSTLNKLFGRVETNAGRVVFKGTQPPVFREEYSMSVKTVVAPKGTYDIYKKAIEDAYYNDEGDYNIWRDAGVELIEE